MTVGRKLFGGNVPHIVGNYEHVNWCVHHDGKEEEYSSEEVAHKSAEYYERLGEMGVRVESRVYNLNYIEDY